MTSDINDEFSVSKFDVYLETVDIFS